MSEYLTAIHKEHSELFFQRTNKTKKNSNEKHTSEELPSTPSVIIAHVFPLIQTAFRASSHISSLVQNEDAGQLSSIARGGGRQAGRQTGWL